MKIISSPPNPPAWVLLQPFMLLLVAPGLFVLFPLQSIHAAEPAQIPEYGQAIVAKDDPWESTHTLDAGVMKLHFGAHGGGYINHVEVPDIPNAMVRETHGRYGRGWQGSARDRLHSNRYNPTQAGWRDFAGTPAPVRFDAAGRFTVDRYNVPLFGDPIFNFVRFDDLAEDFNYGDPPGTDTDGFAEPAGWTQDDEIRSEFDFEGFYEDAGDPAGNGCSVLRIFQRYSYERSAKAILQFGPAALKTDGSPVFDPQQIDIHGNFSTIFPQQQATEIDLAGIIYTAFGIRLNPQAGLTHGLWRSGGAWQGDSLILGGGDLVRFKLPGHGIDTPPGERLDYGFLMLANGSDPNTAKGFALYVPAIERNTRNLIGMDRETRDVIYREDRITDAFILIRSAITGQASIRSRYFLSGLFAPDNGDPDSIEAMETEQYVLYGTPNQVLAAVQAIEADLADLPTIIDPITDQSVPANANSQPLEFVLDGPPDALQSVSISGFSSNKVLVPDENITFGGSGANRTVTVTPAPNQLGRAAITVLVNAGGTTSSMTFAVDVKMDAATDIYVEPADPIPEGYALFREWNWDNDGDLEGWTATTELQLAPGTPANGIISGTASGGARLRFLDALNVSGFGNMIVEFRVRKASDDPGPVGLLVNDQGSEPSFKKVMVAADDLPNTVGYNVVRMHLANFIQSNPFAVTLFLTNSQTGWPFDLDYFRIYTAEEVVPLRVPNLNMEMITIDDTGTVRLSWPNEVFQWTLQSTSDLSEGFSDSEVDVVTEGEDKAAYEALVPPARFYRLSD